MRFERSRCRRTLQSETQKSGDKLFAVKYPLHILIADDDEVNRRVLFLALRRLGYEADTVEKGLDCLSASAMGSFDLVFTDIHMPVMDGLECTRMLRQSGSEIPIVAVTTLSSEDARVQCLAAGMNRLMQKSVRLEELKRALRLAFAARLFKPA